MRIFSIFLMIILLCSVIYIGAVPRAAESGQHVALLDQMTNHQAPYDTAAEVIAGVSLFCLLACIYIQTSRVKDQERSITSRDLTFSEIEQIIKSMAGLRMGGVLKIIQTTSEQNPVNRVQLLQAEIQQSEQQMAKIEEWEAKYPTYVETAKKLQERQLALKQRLESSQEKGKDLSEILDAMDTAETSIRDILENIEKDGNGRELEKQLNLFEKFLNQSEERLAAIQPHVRTIEELKTQIDSLKARVMPLQDRKTGIKALLAEFKSAQEKLEETLNELENDGDGTELQQAVDEIETKHRDLMKRYVAVDEQRNRLKALHQQLADASNGQQ